MENECIPNCQFMVQCLARLGYGPITVRICQKCHFVINISPENPDLPRPGDFLRAPRENIEYIYEEIPAPRNNVRRLIQRMAKFVHEHICPNAQDLLIYDNCAVCSDVAQALRKEKELSDLKAKVIYDYGM